MKFIVYAKVLCSQMYEVEASDPQDAIQKVVAGNGQAQEEPLWESFIGADDWSAEEY